MPGLFSFGPIPISHKKEKLFCPKTQSQDLILGDDFYYMSESNPEPDAEDYLTLLNEHERSLSAYVHALVPLLEDAEDILQSCKVTMWKHFSSFEPGTNFRAWSRKIALNQILNYRRSEKRRRVFSADSEFIEAVAAEIDRQSDQLDLRSEALRACLTKLPEAHRNTVLLRYFEDLGIEEIAEKTKRTAGAVYRLLSRIRTVLNDCITQTLNAQTP